MLRNIARAARTLVCPGNNNNPPGDNADATAIPAGRVGTSRPGGLSGARPPKPQTPVGDVPSVSTPPSIVPTTPTLHASVPEPVQPPSAPATKARPPSFNDAEAAALRQSKS